MAQSTRADAPLSLILLNYVKTLDKVDAQMAAHVAWLEKGFGEDLFLVAGRRTPRTGGVILARGTKAQVAALAQSDPFVTSGVATFDVIAFNSSFIVPELSGLLA